MRERKDLLAGLVGLLGSAGEIVLHFVRIEPEMSETGMRAGDGHHSRGYSRCWGLDDCETGGAEDWR
jgi:hypothetical protein